MKCTTKNKIKNSQPKDFPFYYFAVFGLFPFFMCSFHVDKRNEV